MNATVQGEDGRPMVVTMGCYGIGVTRVVAAAIDNILMIAVLYGQQMKLRHSP